MVHGVEGFRVLYWVWRVYRASLGFGRNVCMVHRVEGFGHATPHTLYYALS